jgi:UDP-GlcNAc:undecaprenyl-phosphate GlcNAc-1-phosphate transferase
LASALLSFCLALVLVPVARWVAWRTGAVDVPRGHKAHGRAVALLGGPAVLAAVGLTLAALRPQELAWMPAAAALALLGLVDDLWGVRASMRLVVELVVCLVLLWATGTRLWTPAFVPGWLATVLTGLWLVGVVNAANCFDCADGSLGGVGALAALGVAGVAALVGHDAWTPALGLAGALAGFAVHNRPPATVFLGDAGSLPVGLLVGWLSVRVATQQPAAFTLAALLVVSVPVFDFLAVHARRWRRVGLRRLMEVRRTRAPAPAAPPVEGPVAGPRGPVRPSARREPGGRDRGELRHALARSRGAVRVDRAVALGGRPAAAARTCRRG